MPDTLPKRYGKGMANRETTLRTAAPEQTDSGPETESNPADVLQTAIRQAANHRTSPASEPKSDQKI